jgi:hypothetical protein
MRKLIEKRWIEKSLIVLCAILLFLVIILGSINILAFYKSYYISEYEKTGTINDISAKYETDKEGARVIALNLTNNMFEFFRGKAELDPLSYTENEISHMKDVRNVLSTINFMYYAAALLLIILGISSYLLLKNDLMHFIELISSIVFWGAILSAAFLILFFLSIVFVFEPFFTVMHLILFPQGNWMFESSMTLMTLFQGQFFPDMALRIFVYALVQSIVFFVIGLWMRKNLKMYRKYSK